MRDTRAQAAWVGRRVIPCPFLKNWKKCPDIGKECPDCIDPCVTFLIYYKVFKVSRGKNCEISPFCVLLHILQMKTLPLCSYSMKPTLH